MIWGKAPTKPYEKGAIYVRVTFPNGTKLHIFEFDKKPKLKEDEKLFLIMVQHIPLPDVRVHRLVHAYSLYVMNEQDGFWQWGTPSPDEANTLCNYISKRDKVMGGGYVGVWFWAKLNEKEALKNEELEQEKMVRHEFR